MGSSFLRTLFLEWFEAGEKETNQEGVDIPVRASAFGTLLAAMLGKAWREADVAFDTATWPVDSGLLGAMAT